MRNQRRRIEARSNEESVTTAFNVKLRSNGYTTEDLQRLGPARRRRGPRRPRLEGPVHYLDLPFLGESAERRIRRAFTREGVNIRVFRRSTSILDVVRPRRQELRKCSWPTCPTAATALCFIKNCMNQVTYEPCGQSYVGSTTRPLHERIREHTELRLYGPSAPPSLRRRHCPGADRSPREGEGRSQHKAVGSNRDQEATAPAQHTHCQ